MRADPDSGDASGAAPPRERDQRVALKETCRVHRGHVPLWPWHRARLEAGGVPGRELAAAEEAVRAAAAGWAGARTRRARLTLVVAPGQPPAVEVAQRLSSLDVPGGLVAARVDLDERPPLPEPAAKPADRSWWDAAHKRAGALGAHQGVLVAPGGAVVDGSTAAVWIAEGGMLLTPPGPPAVPSVAVAFVRAQAQRVGLTVRAEAFTWARFEAADEAFFTNAFGGAAPVRSRTGMLFSAVAELFTEVWPR